MKPVVRRRQTIHLRTTLALWWAAVALVGVFIFLVGGWNGRIFGGILLLVGAVGSLFLFWRSRKFQVDLADAARKIEDRHPELNGVLVTAVEQTPDPQTHRLNFFQRKVVDDALAQVEERRGFETVYRPALFGSTIALIISAVLAWLALSPLLRQTGPLHSRSGPRTFGFSVTPGNTTIERGSSLVIAATFDRKKLPSTINLVIHGTDGSSEKKPMAKALEDPIFGTTLGEVQRDFHYSVEFDGRVSPQYKVRVFEYPALQRADAELQFPVYTGLEDRKVPDTRRLSAVEGTSVSYRFMFNKPVASARLVDKKKEKEAVNLLPDNPDRSIFKLDFTLSQSAEYALELVDSENRTNRVKPQFVFEALPNRRPELKFAFPKGDQQVSALQEMQFDGEASDDFGVLTYGLAYSVGGDETKFIQLGTEVPGREVRKLHHQVALEQLSAEPEQLISYFLWADDFGPDSQVRRTFSDMYFADVRPFEEMFRKGQPSASPGEQEGQGQEQSQGNQMEDLANVQKQIINATWKLQRNAEQKGADNSFKKDVEVVKDSQEELLDRLEQMQARVDDPRLKTFLDAAAKDMDAAAHSLAQAGSEGSAKPLPSAVSSEQRAYQNLLTFSIWDSRLVRPDFCAAN